MTQTNWNTKKQIFALFSKQAPNLSEANVSSLIESFYTAVRSSPNSSHVFETALSHLISDCSEKFSQEIIPVVFLLCHHPFVSNNSEHKPITKFSSIGMLKDFIRFFFLK